MAKQKQIFTVLSSVEYANEANRIAHSAENLYKLGTRLELSDPSSGAARGGGQPGICPPPLGLRQALGRECTHQADQGENGNLQ